MGDLDCLHLLGDEFYAALDGAVGLGLFLLQQDGAGELVDGLVILELCELLWVG